MALTKEQSLRQAIAHEESLFAELAQKHKKSQARLDALKAKLAAMEPGPAVSSAQAAQPGTDVPTTAEG